VIFYNHLTCVIVAFQMMGVRIHQGKIMRYFTSLANGNGLVAADLTVAVDKTVFAAPEMPTFEHDHIGAVHQFKMTVNRHLAPLIYANDVASAVIAKGIGADLQIAVENNLRIFSENKVGQSGIINQQASSFDIFPV